MDEATAKTKWCPFARVVQPAGEWAPLPAGNREIMGEVLGGLNGANRCIASDCMAWRAFPITGFAPGEDISSGYCGLAGAPQ